MKVPAAATMVIAMFAGLFTVYVGWEKQIDRANEIRQQSLLLSEELRQSSDSLTRMARSYVVTGEARYKRHYLEILGIRNGSSPRPFDYHDVYWDVVMADDKRPTAFGPPVPLQTLMQRAGFTQAEFARLASAKEYSDLLTRTEFAAMVLVESHPGAEAERQQALAMLYDQHYHQAKAAIMGSIREFQLMMDKRTLDAVLLAERVATLVRVVFIAFVLMLFATQFRYHRRLRAILGGTAGAVHGHIARLGRGDFDAEIAVPQGREGSVMGRLAATQALLRQAEQEHIRLEGELRNLAYHDRLTGAANRRRGEEVLEQEAERSQRYGTPLCVAMFDVDHFKRINDQYGHAEGDAVLQALSAAISARLRECDLLVRWGGEEFLLILPQTDGAGGMAVAEQLRALVAGLECACGAFTVSVGVAQRQDGEDAAATVRRADAALYRAKREGRNRCELAGQAVRVA